MSFKSDNIPFVTRQYIFRSDTTYGSKENKGENVGHQTRHMEVDRENE